MLSVCSSKLTLQTTSSHWKFWKLPCIPSSDFIHTFREEYGSRSLLATNCPIDEWPPVNRQIRTTCPRRSVASEIRFMAVQSCRPWVDFVCEPHMSLHMTDNHWWWSKSQCEVRMSGRCEFTLCYNVKIRLLIQRLGREKFRRIERIHPTNTVSSTQSNQPSPPNRFLATDAQQIIQRSPLMPNELEEDL